MMEICSVRNEGHLCRTLPSPNKGLTQMWGCHRPGSPSVAAVYQCISVSCATCLCLCVRCAVTHVKWGNGVR